MSYDAWSSEGRALPRVEELPVAEQGYERDAVRQAFDAFYRHIAQLDSTLKTLEAVEVFQRQAGELRTELRALRSGGWTQQPWSSYSPVAADTRGRALMPPALPRIATEVAFLIAVAVIAGVGHFSATLIVVIMAAAWAIVGAVEWFAARERIPPPVAAASPAVIEGTVQPETVREPEPRIEAERAPASAAPSEYGWSAFAEPVEGAAGTDAMTIAGEPFAEAAASPAEEGAPAAAAQEPAAETPLAANGDESRRRWFRRRRTREAQGEPESAPPSNVRVLAPEEREADHWPAEPERLPELEPDAADDYDAAADSDLAPDESTDENAVGPLRRFRRR